MQYIIFVIMVCVTLFLFAKLRKYILAFISSGLLSLLLLTIINNIFSTICIGMNIYTCLIAFIGGIPSVIAMLILKLF